MRLRLLLAAAAVVVAAVLALQLDERQGCRDGRHDLVVAALRKAPPAEQDAAVRAVRDRCPGVAGLRDASRALLLAGRRPEALRIAREMVDREPDNPVSWRALVDATRASTREGRKARAKLRALDPVGAAPRRS